MIGAVFALLSLPPLVALVEAITFHVQNRNNRSIVSSGEEREYLLYVPESYDSTRPTPLVISMHGAGAWPMLQNGLSAGGGMSFVLSCTLSDRIAAIGTVAAARVLPWSWCEDQRPVPMIAFHGTGDSLIPYDGGTTWIGDVTFPDVEEWVANWARRNRCGPDAVASTVAPDVTRRDYTNCAGEAAVVLFTIHGGGHTWPGGKRLPEWFLGSTSQGVDATRQMWTFFQERRLPRR